MNMKPWLDKNVVPALSAKMGKTLPLSIHSEVHSPPDSPDIVVVYLFAQKGTWATHVRRLLRENAFLWDYMRELTKIEINGEARIIFGGDGAPFLHDSGMVSCRLFKKLPDAALILEIGCDHSNKLHAQDDVKELYALFERKDELNFQDVMVKFTPPFGDQ